MPTLRHTLTALAQAVEPVERGQYFLRQGHEDGHRKALARFEAAALAAPAHAAALVLAAQLTHRFEFDWPAARALFQRAACVAPASAYVHHAHALSLMMRADFDGADAELACARQHQAARRALDALVQGWPGRYLSPYQLAMAEVRLGQPAAALGLLQRAVDERDPNALCLPVDPAFDSLHREPAFVRLRERVPGAGVAVVNAAREGRSAGLPDALPASSATA
jgi:hypothetical protein